MKNEEAAASAEILHSSFFLLPSDSNGVHGRNRTCDLHLRTVAL
jgi:hypothetical protein